MDGLIAKKKLLLFWLEEVNLLKIYEQFRTEKKTIILYLCLLLSGRLENIIIPHSSLTTGLIRVEINYSKRKRIHFFISSNFADFVLGQIIFYDYTVHTLSMHIRTKSVCFGLYLLSKNCTSKCDNMFLLRFLFRSRWSLHLFLSVLI